MEKKNPNIYQRALDIVNNRINPDIPQGGGGGGIPEAPADGKQYARQNNEWAEVQGGGESAPEVENAIETHGMGWTDEEEVEGFDIQWDGNTEGLESIADEAYKVTSEVDDITSKDDLIGAKIESMGIAVSSPFTLSADDISTEDGKVFVCSASEAPLVFVAIEDGEAYSMQFTKGIWFHKPNENAYVTRFYKEATTEEVVHQIDQKYIPVGEFTVVIDYDSIGSDTQDAYDEAIAAFQAKKNVLLKKGNVYIPMTGYDSEHCFFGGTASAYLPGNIINAVYAHIGPNGNKFWWGYTIPLGANALSIADEDEHFTGTNVESALAELASRLDALESK